MAYVYEAARRGIISIDEGKFYPVMYIVNSNGIVHSRLTVQAQQLPANIVSQLQKRSKRASDFACRARRSKEARAASLWETAPLLGAVVELIDHILRHCTSTSNEEEQCLLHISKTGSCDMGKRLILLSRNRLTCEERCGE